MSKLYKKFVAMLVMCMVVLGMSVPVFAAESEPATEIQLTNARFIKEDGTELKKGMGSGLVKSAVMNGDNVTVILQPYERKLGITYTGTVEEAYLVSTDNKRVTTNILQRVNGEPTISLNANNAVDVVGQSDKGIRMELKLNMTPFMPPGMHSQMFTYFICDEF